MGKIWLETTDNRLIHLPIVGDDFNSPDDAIKIPTAVLINRNRCFSGTIQIVSPQYGTITFDFTEDGRTGSCNQCGQCCTHPADACPNPGNCGWPLRTIPRMPDFHACEYFGFNFSFMVSECLPEPQRQYIGKYIRFTISINKRIEI